MSAMPNYRTAFARAIAEERLRVKNRLKREETAFLPAALEVTERPVSPTARLTTWVLLAGTAATALWLTFGHLDIVATAPGRIVPTEDVKLVQAATTGIVRHIGVHDGDTVHQGQLLVELDPTVSTADRAQAEKALYAAELDVARDQAIVDGLSGRPVVFNPPPETSPDVVAAQRQLITAQIASMSAEAAGLAAARRSALADVEGARAQVRSYDETAPVLDKELAAMNGLAAEGYAPGLKLMELQRQRRSEAGSRDVAAAQVAHGVSDSAKFSEQIVQSRAQARQSALADLVKAQTDALLRREELTKAVQRSRMQRLVAPVDGTVQQLAVHTLGGVVEPVRPLMVVVPNGALTVEAHVQNKDVGFIHVGQPVAVKLEAFPFTHYGTVPGKIRSINRDSIQDGKNPPYYVARIVLEQSTIQVDGKTVPLTPGLTATSDIRIGSRRIIDYLLGPLETNMQEAGRER